MRLLAIFLLLVPLLAACASSGEGSAPTSSRNVITADELAGVSDLMTLDAIRRLRPS